MTATSGPGFSLMQEAIGYAVMAEVPSVVVNVQRGGPSTGLPTAVAQGDVMQARWGTHGDHAVIALTASNLQDAFYMTVDAFNLAETYRTPVILLFDEVVGHMREKVAFVTASPCVMCAKLLIQADVTHVFYREPYRKPDGLNTLEKGGVKTVHYTRWKDAWR